MRSSAMFALVGLGLPAVLAAPMTDTLQARQGATACFVIGKTTLPQEVIDTVNSIKSAVTCDAGATTIDNVPDVTSGATTFSKIDFTQSNSTPLQFALDQFKASTPLASTDLKTFQDSLNVYQATEAGIRSVGGTLAIKVPKFFVEFQVSRILTAQGNPPKSASLAVDHLRDKVLKNAARESQALLDQVTQLATVLALGKGS